MGATSPNNDLYLKALRGESVSRPPVWMMRQAGRYLPEFMELKEKYDFFTRCQTPELASEITVQPLRRYGMDAAILFSDILVVPQAMNIDVEMRQGVGPFLPNPIRKATDLDRVIVPDIEESLGYVLDAISLTLEKLDNSVPLIGLPVLLGPFFATVCKVKGAKVSMLLKGYVFRIRKLLMPCFKKLPIRPSLI
jgi:uroporphyrinogen decarboxylase